jgi:hypothetical protein
VRLVSADGAALDLHPIRHQFPPTPGSLRDWDGNWLVIHGSVRTAAGEAWSFTDPCLTTWEARELHDWLTAAAAGRVAPTGAGAGEDDLLTFTEPCLAFGVAALDGDRVVVRVHLSLEAAPTRTGDELYAYSVPVELSRADLDAAARAWAADIAPFPER